MSTTEAFPKDCDTINTIVIPSGVDPGDYHLIIRLTDREGWQTLKGISVKLVSR